MHSRPSGLENLTLGLFSKLAICHLDESGFCFSRHISCIFSNDRFWEANFCSIHYQNGRLEELGRKASDLTASLSGCRSNFGRVANDQGVWMGSISEMHSAHSLVRGFDKPQDHESIAQWALLKWIGKRFHQVAIIDVVL